MRKKLRPEDLEPKPKRRSKVKKAVFAVVFGVMLSTTVTPQVEIEVRVKPNNTVSEAKT